MLHLNVLTLPMIFFLKTYKQNEGKNISGSLTETDRDNVVSMVIQNAADLGLFIRTNSDGKSFFVENSGKPD